MKKQMIAFTEPQTDFLEKEANRLGITKSELVRRIVDQYRDGRERKTQE